MMRMIHGYGTKFMVVRPYFPPGPYRAGMKRPEIDIADIEAVRTECTAIQRITPFVYWQSEVAYGREKAENIPTRGVTEQYQTIRNFFVEEGSFFGPIHVENGTPVVVLGQTLRLSCPTTPCPSK